MDQRIAKANVGKFLDPQRTMDGSVRAKVKLSHPETLWFNTGTLCNITCVNCYIESSPTNDRLVYLSPDEIRSYLDQIDERNWPIREIGFTGGEPFLNPGMIEMTRTALTRDYDVLILTNAMRPMMRKRVQMNLRDLNERFGEKLTMRVSLDHWTPERHDRIRGKGSFDKTLEGMRWLTENGFRMTLAGRALWGVSEAEARAAYGRFFDAHGFNIDPMHPGQTVIFPEMDEQAEVPEITTACWNILHKSPRDVMCASSRMVVKRKGADRPTVLACTLLPYDERFDMGPTLAGAERPVALNHPHCAKFCVLGGASCSV